MTNKIFSMVDGKRSGVAHDLSTRLHRPDSVSSPCSCRVLTILLLCLTLFVGVGQMWGAAISSATPTAGSSYVIAVYENNKYYALPAQTLNGATLTGVEVSLNASNKVSTSDASGKTWTLESGTSGFYLTCTVSSTKYYLLRSGSNGKNVKLKTQTSKPDYVWGFASSGNPTVYDVSYNNGSYTMHLASDGSHVYGARTSAGSIILLEIGNATPSCTAPTITGQPTGANYNKNATPTALSITATGTNLTYQWYSNTSNSTTGASSINGATSSSYTPSTATAGTMYYYCIVSSSTCTTTSNIVAVTVTVPVSSVALNKTSTSIVEDQSETLTATVSPNDATNKTVNWSTSDASIATVSGGVVTAKTAGTATITATSAADGTKSASCTVTVTAAPRDHFVDLIHSTEIADKKGSYSTPTIQDKAVNTDGNCAQQHYHFVGWITSDKYEAGTSIAAGDLQSPTSATGETYYAVWAKQGASGGTNTISADLNTLKNAVSSISSGYSSKTFEMSDGVNSYTFTADVTKSSQNTTKNWMQVGRNSDSRKISITDELPGYITNISSTSIYNASASTYNGTVYYNTTASIENPIASTTLSSASDFSMDVTNGGTVGYIILTNPMCLGDLSVTYSTISYEDYKAVCCNELGQINGSFYPYRFYSFFIISLCQCSFLHFFSTCSCTMWREQVGHNHVSQHVNFQQNLFATRRYSH